MLFGVPYPILTQKSKKNIGGGIGAPSFSAVGLILLGHWQKQKTALVCVAESDHTYLQKYTTPGLSGVWDQNRVNSTLYIAFWSVEPTDFKNVIIENIPPALSEDAEVAEVKRPRNSKRQKFYYEKW